MTPDEATEELIRAVLEDAEQHLEYRLAAIQKDFANRLRETREYMNRRTRERIKELGIADFALRTEDLNLRRKKNQPVIPDWRVPGGQLPPDERKTICE